MIFSFFWNYYSTFTPKLTYEKLIFSIRKIVRIFMISLDEIFLWRLCVKNLQSLCTITINKTLSFINFNSLIIRVFPFFRAVTSKYFIVLWFNNTDCMSEVLCKVPEREIIHGSMDTLIVNFYNFYQSWMNWFKLLYH